MTRWEYRVEHIQNNLQATLTRLGADGWELASNDGYRFVFKRPTA